MAIVISLTDCQADFIERILLNLKDVSTDLTVVSDAKAILAKMSKQYNAQADHHE